MLRILCLISCCCLALAAAELTLSEPSVDGVRIVHRQYDDGELRPLNWNPGYAIAVSGVLSRPVTSIAEAQVTVARTDTGQDLIKEGHWGGRIGFPEVGADGTRLLATVELQKPAAAATMIAELRCVFTIQESAGAQPLRVENLPLKAGSSVTVEDIPFTVESVQESQWQEGTYEIAIKIPVVSEALAAARMVGSDGEEQDLSTGGHMQMNDVTTFTFRLDEQPPEQATIIFDLHRDMQTSEVELHMADVPLLGTVE